MPIMSSDASFAANLRGSRGLLTIEAETAVPPLSTTRFDELKATNQLPSPSGVALAILRLVENEKSTIQEITQVLMSDPALCGRLLKIANSSFSGRARPASSVKDAYSQLGGRLVRNVALSFSLLSQYERGTCKAFDYPAFWSHSLAMGVSAQAGAHHTGGIVSSEAFTCGLLAQVGTLAFVTIYPDAYAEIIELVRTESNLPQRAAKIRAAERERFATDHVELGAAMLRDWGLPETFIVAIERMDSPKLPAMPNAERVQTLIRLLRMASRMADVCLATEAERSHRMFDLLAVAQETKIETKVLLALCDRVVAEWRDWGKILQVETKALPPFEELAESAKAAAKAAEKVQLADSTANSAVSASAAARLSIVVVDDEPAALQTLTKYLASAGHTVYPAKSGQEALGLVVERNPQLVITDWQMPGMDGIALTKALRQTKMGRQLYIIMLGGSADEDAQIRAFEAGADDYIVKSTRPKLVDVRLGACARVVSLQEEMRRDKEDLHRYMKDLGVANRKLQNAALTDPLTGLYNRRFCLERLEQEWAESVQTGKSLACLLIDIDHFKRVNDTYGHDVGDHVLVSTAGVLQAKLRSSDVACRLGGEEFLVIGSSMDRETALACAERLRADVEAQTIRIANAHLRVTLSIGVSLRRPTMAASAELIKSADEAVYLAKANGRNQVRIGTLAC
jgi:two-component system, cell cycle response regulator